MNNHMSNMEEQLKNLQKMIMNTEEKSVLRDAVVSYMKENPAKNAVVRNPADSRLQYRTSNVINPLIHKKGMTIAIIIALLLGGGTSFAAENALPGDVLYPIKIHVNESVQELVAVSDEAEARVQAKIAARRLEEVEKLAVAGRLDAQTSADLKASFEEHSEKSKERQTKVRVSDDADASANISSDIEVSLGTHEKVLEDIGNSKPKMRGFIGGILDGVGVRLHEEENLRAKIETKTEVGAGSDTQASAEGAMNVAKNKIEEVKSFVDSKRNRFSAKMETEVGVRLEAMDATMWKGRSLIERQIEMDIDEKTYREAFGFFKQAMREAESLKLFIITSLDLGAVVEEGQGDDANYENNSDYWTEKEKMRDAKPAPDGRIVPSDAPDGSGLRLKVGGKASDKVKIETEENVGGGGSSGKANVRLQL